MSSIAARIEQLAEKYGNSFPMFKSLAARADVDGREVYWSTQTYHNQVALLLLDEALRDGLATALRTFPRGAEQIDTLIPLNAKAIAALEEARWHAGAKEAAE